LCYLGTMMDLSESVEDVQSRHEFVAFVRALLRDLQQHPDTWENADLERFIEALAAWVEDMDGYYQNLGRPVPEQPSWKLLSEILLAARIYE
jgi:hypothetical protein